MSDSFSTPDSKLDSTPLNISSENHLVSGSSTGNISTANSTPLVTSVNTTPHQNQLNGLIGSIATTSMSGKHEDMVPKAEYERLKLEMKLREADNTFLQEELENKDKMLHLLTAGLKEVRKQLTLSTFAYNNN